MPVTNCKFMLKQLCDAEANIRGTLSNLGLKVHKIGRCGFAARVLALVADQAALVCRVTMLRARTELLAAFNRLHKKMFGAVRADPVCRWPMMVPGVGAVTASTFRTTTDVLAGTSG